MCGFILLQVLYHTWSGGGVLFLKERVESLDWLSTRGLAQTLLWARSTSKGKEACHSVFILKPNHLCHLFAIYV